MKIGKSDFIDIDCIDQSAEIDDTLISSIDFTDFSDSYRKKSVSICSSKN